MRKSEISNRHGNIVADRTRMPIVPPAALKSAKAFMPESDPLFNREQTFASRMEEKLQEMDAPRRKTRDERARIRSEGLRNDSVMAQKAREDRQLGLRRREYQGRRSHFGTEADRFAEHELLPDALDAHASFYSNEQSEPEGVGLVHQKEEDLAIREEPNHVVDAYAEQVQEVVKSQENHKPKGTAGPPRKRVSRGEQLSAQVEAGGTLKAETDNGGTPAFANVLAKNPKASAGGSGRRKRK